MEQVKINEEKHNYRNELRSKSINKMSELKLENKESELDFLRVKFDKLKAKQME